MECSGQKSEKFVVCQEKGASKCTPFPHLVWQASSKRWSALFVIRTSNINPLLRASKAKASDRTQQKKRLAWVMAYSLRLRGSIIPGSRRRIRCRIHGISGIMQPSAIHCSGAVLNPIFVSGAWSPIWARVLGIDASRRLFTMKIFSIHATGQEVTQF